MIKSLVATATWSVVAESPEDGLFDVMSRWSTKDLAVADFNRRQERGEKGLFVRYEDCLYLGDDGEYYSIYPPPKHVLVDVPSAEEVKAKLTKKELAVLGLKP